MITNNGKEIIAKYILGQAPSYATHISLGCGAEPNTTGDFSNKKTMDFEMIRIPISSRGFVNDNGVSKIALSAEMPTEYRYEITEVGLWSAGSNTAATNSDSRMIFTFADDEGWQLHKTDSPGSTGPIPSYFEPLDGGDDTNNINVVTTIPIVNKQLTSNVATLTYTGDPVLYEDQKVTISGVGSPFDGDIYIDSIDTVNKTFSWNEVASNVPSTPVSGGLASVDVAVFGTTADNESLLSSIRQDRREGSRYLNYTIFMRGDTSSINSSFVVSDGSAGNSSHIHLDGRNFNLSKNSPKDQLKFALSIVPKEESNVVVPYATRIVMEFFQSENNTTVGYARLKHQIDSTDLSADNRYYVITKELKDLETSPDFSWSEVRLSRVYVSVFKLSGDTQPSDEYYVVLDAVRFDNLNSYNPLYVMSGYSVIEDTRPIVKTENTSNYIEFRFGLGVA